MTKENVLKIVLVGIAATLFLLLYFFAYPLYGKYFPKCIFHSLTGLYCPGCGSQRAISSLLHRRIAAAFHFNALLIVSLPFIIYTAIIYTLNNFVANKVRLLFIYSPLFSKAAVIIVILFWIIRNIPAYPFTLLAPDN